MTKRKKKNKNPWWKRFNLGAYDYKAIRFDSGSLITFIIILICVVSLWSYGVRYMYSNYYVGNEIKGGQLGDTLGAVNSFFSAVAFAGIFYTILLQRKELRDTREEFVKQNETLKLQRFENSFYKLLELHNLTVDRVTTMDGARRLNGRESINYIYKVFQSSLNSQILNTAHYEIVLTRYKEDIEVRGMINDLALYLKSLHRMLAYIRSTELIWDDTKHFYYSVISSSMDDSEKAIVYYYLSLNAVSDKVTLDLLSIEYLIDFFSSPGKYFHSSHSQLRNRWEDRLADAESFFDANDTY
jgi:hypothetical protein